VALVDGAVLRALRVGADRRRVDEPGDAGACRGLEHPLAAADVDGLGDALVPGGLDQPGEVDHRVRALEQRVQVGLGDVGLPKLGLLVPDLRQAAGEAQDGFDRRISLQGGQHARSGVPSGSRDYDAHAVYLPGSGPYDARAASCETA
jgi:hypothetical protein